MGNCVSAKGPKKDPKRLTEEEIRLLLDNTRLTRAEIIGLHNNFLKECPTGKLTKKDFIKLFKEVHPSENKKEKANKFCEYVFKVIDQQNLGYISFQEFVLCFSLTSDGDFKDKCEFAFKLYDLDKDGKISKKEMTQVLEALYDLSGITDRKGNKAPAKKVEEIIKAINAKSALASTDPALASQSIIIINDNNNNNNKAAEPKLDIHVTDLAEAIEIKAPSAVELNASVAAPSISVNAEDAAAASSSSPIIEVTAPVVSISSADNNAVVAVSTKSDDKKSKEEKKKEEKLKKEKEKKEKATKSKEPKPKETKEEKAAKKEREKQEKERLKQEKEREKKEKAEKAKQEKLLKEKEKKEKAELKKAEQSKTKAASKDKTVAVVASKSKSPKPAKKSKSAAEAPVEYITKDQFIEACTTDEGIKKLFVDSIFCAQPDISLNNTNIINNEIANALNAEANGINVSLPSVELNLPSKVDVSSKTITLTTTKTTTKSNDGTTTTETITERREKSGNNDRNENNNEQAADEPKKFEVTFDNEKVNVVSQN